MHKRVKRLLPIIGLLGLFLFSVLPYSASVEAQSGTVQPTKPKTKPNANGDNVHETFFSQACQTDPSVGQGIGVGIAFDGKYLWYSCYKTGNNPDLYKTDPISGTVLASFNVAGGLGTLAWDGQRKKFWAGWGGSGTVGDIRLIDPATGIGTVMFNAADAVAGTNSVDIDDGLAYNFQDDSLYVSPDTSTTIYHYSTGGALLDSFPWAGSSCYNSGLAIGGSLLFEGSDGCNHIWVVRRSDHSAAFDFPTGADGVRDEGMSCDSVTFSPKTVMWSIEAYEPRRAIAYEIPAGSCDIGGGVDTDKDGLLDSWETSGVTIDGGAGPQFINLPAMGADPNIQDIFIQIDWMQDATHNTKLDPAALKMVVDAFAAHNIHVHIDQGPDSILNYTTGATWGTLSKARALPWQASLGSFDASGNYDWTAFQAIKDANFTLTGRTPIFHYIIAANNYATTTSSGISRGIGASDLIVSLGSFTWANNAAKIQGQAGTLMHELGHNLSLRHGGSDNTNYKPNFLSIMNYAFQIRGLIKGGVQGTLDYSEGTLGTLNEPTLNEGAGLGAGAAGYGTSHYCTSSGTFVAVNNANAPIDWNCNGSIDAGTVAADVNNDGNATDVLTGFNDWPNLQLKGGGIGLAGIAPSLPITTDNDIMTVDQFSKIQPLGVAETLSAVAGTSQSALINTAFATPLQVKVTDSGGNPLGGVNVFFSAPSSGASGTFVGSLSTYVTTTAQGIATAPTFTANGTTGSYVVSAAVVSATTSANFALTNTNGVAGYTYYLPFLGNQAGGYTSYLVFQNNTTNNATISLQYFTPSGTLFTTDATCPTLAGRAECIPNNPFSTGNKGSGVIVSSQPLNVVVAEGTPYGGSAYAVSGGGSNSLVAPLIFRNAVTGDFNTQLTVFNGGAAAVTATVTFYDQNGNAQPSANQTLANIAPNSSATLDQSLASSNLPNNFYGWAQISSPAGSTLVAQVLEQSAGQKFVAIANAQATPQTTLYAPAIFKGAFNFNTGANIVNPNGTAVQVTVTYYDDAGNPTTTTPFTLPAYAIQAIYQGGNGGTPGLPGGSGLAAGFSGAATVSSTGGGVVMVVNESGGVSAAGASLSGVYGAAANGASSVGLPVMANGGFTYITGATIFNTTNQTITGQIQYYQTSGTPQGSPVPFSIGPYASQLAYQGGSSGLPAGFYGTAVVTQNGGTGGLIVTTNALSGLFYTYTEPNS